MGKVVARRQKGSVQRHFVRVREILDDVLCLFAPHSPTKRSYRVVLEVAPINFLLKAPEEQDALIERYQAILKSLSYPLQIIVRNQRLDVRPYLARLRASLPAPELQEQMHQHARASGETFLWPALVEDQIQLLQQIASSRTLIERHCYVVLPAPEFRGIRLSRAQRRERALQELRLRVERFQGQLASLGLRSQRVRGEALARLCQSFLTPERALNHPLQREHLAAVGHFPRLLPHHASKDVDMELPALQESANLRPSAPAEQEETLQHLPAPDLLRLADLLAPASVEEERDYLRVEDEFIRGFAVVAFPREVSAGWLAPLFQHHEILDLCWHIHPQDRASVKRMLRRRRVAYTSTRGLHQKGGYAPDPDLDLAQADVTRMMHDLASGEERLSEVSLLVLVRASNRDELEERSERLRALLQSVFLDPVAHATTFEHALAFRSILPEGQDELLHTNTVDTTTQASMFQFLSHSLTMPEGIFLGMTETDEPIFFNPRDPILENNHMFVGGVTGAGKSGAGQVMSVRTCEFQGLEGERFYTIDPDGEHTRRTLAMGGNVVRLAPGSTHCLNPFDLVLAGCDFSTYVTEVARGDRLAEKIQDLHSLLEVMLADAGSTLGTREKALLDRTLYEVYRRVGISSDPRTHYHQPPLLRDLAEVLRSGVCGPDDFDLELRLSRYINGSLASLFTSPTNVALESHQLTFDVRDMRGDLRPIGIFLIADAIWSQAIYQSQIRRCLLIDEAASLIEYPEAGRFLTNLSRRARKRSLRLVVMTQNPELFVQDKWGGVIAANAAIKLLKRQDRTSVQAVTERFGLTPAEAGRLLTMSAPEALLLAGDRRVLLSMQATPRELHLITTDPVALAAMTAAGSSIGEEQRPEVWR